MWDITLKKQTSKTQLLNLGNDCRSVMSRHTWGLFMRMCKPNSLTLLSPNTITLKVSSDDNVTVSQSTREQKSPWTRMPWNTQNDLIIFPSSKS